MLDQLRKPLFIIALVLIGLAVLVELASTAILGDNRVQSAVDAPTPGFGIPYLALIDGLVLFSVLLIALSLLLRERLQGRIQGIITLIVSILVALYSIFKIIIAFLFLLLTVTLLLSVPFGTIAYFALYADFDTGGARIALSLLMTLKLCFAGCLVFAHQRFLQNKGLVLIIVTSLVGNLIVTFLHSLVPGFLVTITDALAAIILGILALIWAIVFLIGSIISIIKAIV